MSFPDGGNGDSPEIFLAKFARTNPHIMDLKNTAINNTLKKNKTSSAIGWSTG